MDYSSTVQCPACNRLITVTPQGCAVRVKDISEAEVSSPQPPPLSRLHAAALEEIVEGNNADALRLALLQVQRRRQSEWASANGQDGKVDEDWTFIRSKMFSCPYCSAELNLFLDVTIAGVVEVVRNPGQQASARRIQGADPQTAEFVQLCSSSGVLSAFEEAWQEQVRLQAERNVVVSPPRVFERAFVAFLKTAVRGFPSHPMFSKIRADNGGKDVQYWRSNGVGLITVGGEIHRFVPMRLFEGDEATAPSPLHDMLVRSPAPKPVRAPVNGPPQGSGEVWVKSRYGYVPPGCHLFLDELRRNSAGAFANPSQ